MLRLIKYDSAPIQYKERFTAFGDEKYVIKVDDKFNDKCKSEVLDIIHIFGSDYVWDCFEEQDGMFVVYVVR